MHMEDNLDLPLREVLKKMQEGIVTRRNHYRGIFTCKNPIDVWVYQQIVHDTRPTVIVEIGTYCGGSAVMFHDMLQIAGGGRVISVDPCDRWIDARARAYPIQFVTATAVDGLRQITIQPQDRVMVVEDSVHDYDFTLRHLRAYAALVSVGCYLVVEDTNFNHGLPGPAVVAVQDGLERISWDGKPYPHLQAYRAVQDFAREDPRFQIDRSREPFFVTGNPSGFLRKVAA